MFYTTHSHDTLQKHTHTIQVMKDLLTNVFCLEFLQYTFRLLWKTPSPNERRHDFVNCFPFWMFLYIMGNFWWSSSFVDHTKTLLIVDCCHLGKLLADHSPFFRFCVCGYLCLSILSKYSYRLKSAHIL